jgi:hypothetical protein
MLGAQKKGIQVDAFIFGWRRGQGRVRDKAAHIRTSFIVVFIDFNIGDECDGLMTPGPICFQ